MPLEIPERRAVTSTLQAYSRAHLPDLDPSVTTRRGYIGGLLKSLSSALHDWYVALKRYADYEPFPQTATEPFLLNGWWMPITQLTRNPAAPARGRLVIEGTAGSALGAGATLSGARGSYLVDSSQSIVAQSLSIASLTRSGSTVTATTTAAEHDLASGQVLTISGAVETDYNGAYEIEVTGANVFTYEVTTTPTTPATGTLLASGIWGNIDVTCTETGPEGNVDAGETLSVGSPPAGVNTTARIGFGGISGGVDVEDIEEFRTRVLEALGTDYGMFSAAEIKIVTRQIPGVTRVWVVEAEAYTGTPLDVYEGQVKIAFVRDGDTNIFPSSVDVATVKAHILDTIKPAHTAEEDVMVISPTPQSVNFVFSALSPDTASMRRAIRASLEQLFAEGVDFATDLDEDAFRCAIRDAWDAERRQGVRSFTLSSPTATVAVGADSLPILGTITWPT